MRRVAYSPNGQTVAACSDDRTIKLLWHDAKSHAHFWFIIDARTVKNRSRCDPLSYFRLTRKE
jgi:hypothetical protein